MDMFAPADALLAMDFLVLPDVSLLSLASALEPLRAANRVTGREHYRWRLLSPDGGPIRTSSGLTLPVDGAFQPEAERGVLAVVASFNVARHATPELLGRLRRAARRGVPVGGIEAGAWVLARGGLLDGHRATTHWEDLEDFAAAFPAIEVVSSRFVVDRQRFTTGGASPALDMMLELIRLRQGYAAALGVASVFIYDQSRSGADPQPVVSLGRLGWHEPRVARTIRLMEETIDRPLSIAALARRAGTSARTLETLFLSTVGLSPRDFYGGLRLDAARRLVLETRETMTAIAARVGFASASAFARAFRQRFGTSPTAARRARL